MTHPGHLELVHTFGLTVRRTIQSHTVLCLLRIMLTRSKPLLIHGSVAVTVAALRATVCLLLLPPPAESQTHAGNICFHKSHSSVETRMQHWSMMREVRCQQSSHHCFYQSILCTAQFPSPRPLFTGIVFSAGRRVVFQYRDDEVLRYAPTASQVRHLPPHPLLKCLPTAVLFHSFL